MAKEQTAAKTIRLTLREWAELDYAAAQNGRNRNDEIRWRLAQHAVPMPDATVDGQTSIYDAIDGGSEGEGVAFPARHAETGYEPSWGATGGRSRQCRGAGSPNP